MEVEHTTTSITSLPFKRVVIYKNGVAYFEREGKVSGNCSIDLHFKSEEMNDIIRSLRVVDLDGGKIANISYESPSPPEVPPGGSALNTSIFSFLVGSNVSITRTDSETPVVGRVLGTNDIRDVGIVRNSLQILVDNTKIQFIDTLKIASMDIIDSHVKGNVKENLDSVLNAKKKDTRQVSIICKGANIRTVRVSYILENPIWKSSYRIYMKRGPDGKEKLFFLEGWACIDNISEYDWNEVTIALVSGSPITFQHDVYNPIIGVRPTQFSDEGKTAQNVTMKVIGNKPTSPYSGMPPPAVLPNNAQHLRNQMQHQQQLNNMQYMQQMQQQQMQQLQPQSLMNNIGGFGASPALDIDSQTVEIGNLFHYEITTPITLKKDHSSLVPTVSGPIKGRQVCWFDPNRHAVNAMECLMLKNTLGAILDKGPVIVTQEESYLGESIFENTMMADEHKLLPYSVNLECKVAKSSTSSTKPKRTVIRAGMIYVTNNLHRLTDFTLTNNSEHEIELVLDHEEYIVEKIEGAKSQAKWKNGTRFYIMLPPIKKTQFPILIVSTSTHMEKKILEFNSSDIAHLYTSRYINRATFDGLMGIYTEAKRVHKLRQEILDLKSLEESIIQDQRRVQGLMNSTSQQQFLKQLTDLENKLAEARKRQVDNKQTWDVNRESVAKAVNEFRIEINLETENIPYDASVDIHAYQRTPIDELLSDLSGERLSKRQRT